MQCMQALVTHGPAQALAPDTVALAAQSDLQPARAVGALVAAEDLD
jgi:hypothetical protein